MIDHELQATTEPGRRFVAMAEEHAKDFATRADQHDREASFPFENIKALQESGFLAAMIPEEFGGLGVESRLDQMIGMSRLARGCASSAIAANMHIAATGVMSRMWRWREGQPPQITSAVEALMRAIGARQLITCAPGTEAGTDLQSPMTEGVPDGDHYIVNGRKMFGTLSPAAQLMFVTFRIPDGDGYQSSMGIIPSGAPGVTNKNNWDAMGMRASGSHDIVFENVRIPAASVLPPRPWGVFDGSGADMGVALNGSLVACFLGIAEAARNLAIEMTGRRKGPKGMRLADRAPIQQLIAEIEVELMAGRAVVERAGRISDEYFDQYRLGEAPNDVSFALMKEQQCMKWTLQRNAISIVDKAMTATGGSAYMNGSPFSRLYRDVRAGPFMQPFAPYEALEFIGKFTLGLDPAPDR
ncbi:MAG: acyl-CoA dehydrogenase family protein [Dehalococcoidia bacterium]